jgi:phosphoribosylaminoimidazole-succinocarboxamide synthase
VLADRLPEPIFTPATKATTGHDENITESQTRDLLGDDLYEELRRRSVDIYLRASDYAAGKGVILADTKFEFGFAGDELLLVDEVLTPDSSRYWPVDEWVPGNDVPSFDKQYVREWLDTTDWDRTPPPPDLPDDIVAGTRDRYVEAYERITGSSFDDYLAGSR